MQYDSMRLQFDFAVPCLPSSRKAVSSRQSQTRAFPWRPASALLAIVLLGTLADAPIAQAQFSGNSSMSNPSASFSNSSSMFGSGSGMSANTGSQVGGQSSTFTMTGGTNTKALQTGFVGANLQQNASSGGFVGAAQLSTSTGPTNTSAAMGGAMGGMMGGAQASRSTGTGASQNNRSRTTATSIIRTRLVVGFENTARNQQVAGSSLTARLQSLPTIHWTTPAQVAMQGRTVVLQGAVSTEHERELVERVVLLDAGVDKVENQLTVASSASSAK